MLVQAIDMCGNIGARLYEPSTADEVTVVFPQLQPDLTREGGKIDDKNSFVIVKKYTMNGTIC